MWAVVEQGAEAEVGHEHSYGGEAEDDKREDEEVEHRHLDVVGFDFFAEVLGGSADHEAGDEDGDDDEDEHAVEAGAYATEDDLAEHDVGKGNKPAKRGKRIVHGVDGAAARVRGDGGEEGGVGDAEANFLAFHVAAGLGERGVLVDVVHERVGLRFGPVADEDAAEPEDGHRSQDGPAVFGRADHGAQRHGEAGGDEEDGEELQEVREGGGVLEGVRAVGVEEAAAVGAQHLDGFLRSDGALRDRLRGDVVDLPSAPVTVCG